MRIEARWVAELAAVLIIFVGGLAVGYAAGRQNSPPAAPVAAATAAAPSASAGAILAATHHFKGDEKATVTLIEFGDFQ